MLPSDDVEVWLVRHGETEWALNGRHTGISDIPLTERGRQVAAGLAPKLAGTTFDAVLTSPLQRARTTAALAGFPDAEVTPALLEWHYGDYEGRTTVDIHKERPDWFIWTDGTPGGESPADVADRVEQVIDRCRAAGGRTLLFAHAHVLRSLAVCWIDQPMELGAHLPLGTAHVCILGYDRGVPTLTQWNAPL